MKAREKMVRNIFSIAGNFLPASILFKLTSRIVLPSYTVISDNYLPHITHLFKPKNTHQFRKDMDFFLKHFEPISLPDLISLTKQDKKISKNFFHLTFHDGLKECYDTILPVLKEKGVPATFFINPSFVDNQDMMHRYKVSLILDTIKNNEQKKQNVIKFVKRKLGVRRDAATFLLTLRYPHRRVMDELAQMTDVNFPSFLATQQPYMTKGQIQKLIDEGFTIGAHSMDHPEYYMLPEEEQLKQTRDSISYIEREFEADYKVLAFPFSDNRISENVLRQIYQSENPLADLILGTSARDISSHLQWTTMDGTTFTGQEVIKGEFIYWYLQKLTGKAFLPLLTGTESIG